MLFQEELIQNLEIVHLEITCPFMRLAIVAPNWSPASAG
jgi:hypothetical protein